MNKHTYSKHFEHEGIIVNFDRLSANSQYPGYYVAIKNGAIAGYIPRRSIVVTHITGNEGPRVATFKYISSDA